MTKKHKIFSNEFKLQAIQLAEKCNSVPETAKHLGISDKSLYLWIKQFKELGHNAFPGKGKLSPEEENLKKLESENKRLKMELDFLKKATTYFATKQK